MNYYDILSIKKDASLDEIQKAYKDKSFQFHPDFNRGISDDSMFRVIKEAYETLSDPIKKHEYDNSLDKANERLHKKQSYDNKYADNNIFAINDQSPNTEDDIVKRYEFLNKDNYNKPEKPSKFSFLINKEWIFLYAIFSLIFLYKVGSENPRSFGDIGIILAYVLGIFIALFGITTILVLFKLMFRQKTSPTEFAYISIIILILGFISKIL